MKTFTFSKIGVLSPCLRPVLAAFAFLFWAATAVAQAPTISSFSPGNGPVGSIVTINGTNLGTATSSSIGGTSAVIVSKSATKLVAMVMPGATTGVISVTNGSGSASSSGSFTVNASKPPHSQQGNKLVGAGSSGASQQGYSTAISADGNTAIVGGAFDAGGPGAAWIFTRTGSTWSQQGSKIAGLDSIGDPYAGWSVALSADGNTAIVGGPNDNSGIGAAWVFVRSGSTWAQQGTKLVGTGSTGGTGGLVYEGSAVSLSADGNTAVIGGFYDNNLKGAIWVFTRSGSTWSQVGSKLSPNDNTGFAAFGCSVAMSADGKTFIGGGYYDNNNVGAAWIFTYNGSSWSQQGNKLAGSGSVGSGVYQGFAVDISADGNTAISGGNSDDNGIGAAWVFKRTGTTWSQQGSKLVGTGYSGSNIAQGSSVALSADGNTALVGGTGDNSNVGAAWVFQRSGSTWSQTGNKLTGTGNTGGSQQGYSCDLSANGENAIVGGYGDNSFKGAAWIFVPASTNTNLSNLTISSGTLTPVFSSSTISYTASVTNATSSVTVTPTAQDANATIQVRVNNGPYQTVASGTASTALALNVGSNTIEVVVTAEDGTSTKTYTITVTRACPNFNATLTGSASICAGSSTNLTVNMAGGTAPFDVVYSGGTINNYASGANIPVSPSSNTTYTLTSVTDNNGCTATVSGTATVTIKAVAGISTVTAAANPICPGSTTTLTANGVTGANAVVTFWTGSNGTGTNLGTGTTLPNAGAGTYYARVTADCGAPDEASVTVTTNTVASVVNQTASACSGHPFTVSPSGVPAGTTYSWGAPTYSGTVSGGSAQSNQTSITQTLTNSGASDGTATYTVTPKTGSCNGATFSVTATIHPGPTPTFTSSPGATTCAGNNVTYTTQAGMSNYSWSVQGVVNTDYSIVTGGTGTGSNSVTLKWLTAGSKTVTVNYMNGNGCTGGTAASSTTTVSTGATPAVGISITSGTNPTCQGNSITFTATPSNGGTNPTYQWYKNSQPDAGATGASYTVNNIAPGNTPTVYVVMTVGAASCVTSNTATSSSITISIVGNSWTGSYSNQFGDGRNWCSGTVPTSSSDIFIPVTSRDPLMSANHAIHNIQIQQGAKLTIDNCTLTVTGTVAGTGQFSGTGNSTLALAASTSIGTLYFSTGGIGSLKFTGSGASANLGNTLNVYSELNVGSATLNTGGNLTMKSTINGTSWVAPITTGNINGAVTVERYIPKNAFRAWRLLSVPVKGGQTFHQAWQENQPAMVNGNPGYGTLLTSAVGGNSYDAQTAGNSLLTFNSVGQNFVAVSNTDLAMQTTAGYFVYIRGDRGTGITGSVYNPTATTLRTNGTLYQGTQPAITIPVGKNVLIGNIYAAPIDFDNLTRTGVSSFKVWDPKLAGTYNLGAYQTFSSINGYDPIPGGGSYGSTPNSRIESGAAFFVNSVNGGSIQLTEAAKTTGSRNVFRNGNQVQQLRVNLYANTSTGTELADGNAVVFDDNYSNAVDDNDVEKLKNFGENIAVDRSGHALTLEARHSVIGTDTIFYNIGNLKQQQYTLEFVPKNMTAGISGYLEDSYLHTSTPIDLTTTQTVAFTVTTDAASGAPNRFRLVFRASGILPVCCFLSIAANKRSEQVQVDWRVSQEQGTSTYEIERSVNARDFDTKGSKAAIRSGSNVSYSWLDESPVAGDNYYRVKSVSTTGEVKYSAVVKVAMGAVKEDFVITPNPVTDGQFDVQFVQQPKGDYSIKLSNQRGQVLYTNKVRHEGGNGTYTVLLSQRVPSGNYQVEIISATGRAIKSILISNGK